MPRTKTYSNFINDFSAQCAWSPGNSPSGLQEEQWIRSELNLGLRHALLSDPLPDTSLWEQRTVDANKVLRYRSTGFTHTEKFWLITDADPYTNNSVAVVNGIQVSNGILVPDAVASTSQYWCLITPEIHEFNGPNYDNATAYTVDQIVFYPVTGEYYRCLAATTGNLPTNTSFWVALTIPSVVYKYLLFSTVGKHKLSRKEEDAAYWIQTAVDELALEKLNASRNLYSLPITTHINYLNIQSRNI